MNIRKLVLDKFSGKCAYCGCDLEFKTMQIDHLIPQYWLTMPNPTVTNEDVYSFKNLMPSCRPCNRFKSTLTIELFRSELEAQIERLRKYQSTFRLAEKFGLIECKPKHILFYFETFT